QDGRPFLQRDIEQLVDFRLRADVHAGGRILEDVDLRFQVQPASDRNLLLVAAGKQLDGKARIVGAQAHGFAEALGGRALARRRQPGRGPAPAACGLRKKFSRTDSPAMIDSPTRSAQTRLTPRSMARRGEPSSTVVPSIRIHPPVMPSTPNSARP